MEQSIYFFKKCFTTCWKIFSIKEDQARTPSQESHFGLGLSFVKRVMKLHNGTMHLENIDNGAQVKLIIPIII